MSEEIETDPVKVQEILDALEKRISMLESQLDKEVKFNSMLTTDNRNMRSAGLALAEAGLRVCREYDGTHRLMLAVSAWSTVVAGEGGRAARAAIEAAQPPSWRDAAPVPAEPLGDSTDVVGPDLLDAVKGKTLAQLVDEAMQNAADNGYADENAKMTDIQLADDLIEKDADIGKYRFSHILSEVQRWRAEEAEKQRNKLGNC